MNLYFILFSLLQAAPAPAQELTAVPLDKILSATEQAELSYMGHGLTYGFVSIESCLWKSKDMLVIRHYCFPAGNYPARSFELWSRKFGIVQFYEEKMGQGRIKRDVRINGFPEFVAPTFPDDFRTLNLKTVNEISEKLYLRDQPACWSTNFDLYSGGKLAACYQTDASLFPQWSTETQALVNQGPSWEQVLRRLLRKTSTSF